MRPREIVNAWVNAFNRADVDTLVDFYSETAVNHQVAARPVEWRDPQRLRGCGFFHVIDDKIAFQRDYWDKLSFFRLHGLPLPEALGNDDRDSTC